MSVNDGYIDLNEVILGDTVILRISIKQNGSKLMLDIRKWNKWANLGDSIVPSKKGIMLDLDTWTKILPLISKMIDSNSVDNNKREG